MNDFNGLGFGPADILIPKDCDMTKWSVIACDQYTSQPEYWREIDGLVGQAPSTLRISLPEVYLESPDLDKRICDANRSMESYLDQGLFNEYPNSILYLERTQSDGKIRRGLVGAVDLECYDFMPGAGTLVRSSEGTILSRLPPRIRVRENAALELPHIMLLIDDREDAVIGSLAGRASELEKVYDCELMAGGGHVKGYLADEAAIKRIAGGLSGLADAEGFQNRYGADCKSVLLYAVGDGNHSLATAKECWNKLKEKGAPMDHPARFALAELVNIHDKALEFEPIHRVVFDVDPLELLKTIEAQNIGKREGYAIPYVHKGGGGEVFIGNNGGTLPIGALQHFLDGYLSSHKGASVDYIHGEDVVRSLASQPGRIGFLLPTLGKSEFFNSIIRDGNLPRKTFSMGNANDKRFYLECRKIVLRH